MSQQFDFERLVPEAAAILDSRDPQWAAKIDTNTLDMSTKDRCIAGQLGFDQTRGLPAGSLHYECPDLLWLVEIDRRLVEPVLGVPEPERELVTA